MALAYVHRNATFTSTTLGSSAVPVTLATAAASGNLVVVVATTSSNLTVASVSDSKGNSWAVNAQTGNANGSCAVAASKLTTPLSTSDTITVNYSGTPGGAAIAIDEFSGALSTVDSFAVATGTSTNTETVGPTGSLAAGDLMILATTTNNGLTGFTAPAGYTALASFNPALSIPQETTAYQLGGSSGATTVTATLTNTPSWEGVLVAFKNAVPVVVPTSAAVASAIAATKAASLITPTSTTKSAASLNVITVPELRPVASSPATASSDVEWGSLPNWKWAFKQYQQGKKPLTVVALGASIIEGYNVGPTLRTVDGMSIVAGIQLSQWGNPSVHPSVYYTGTWSQSTSTPAPPDPAGADPWTRGGQINNVLNQQGNADMTANLQYIGGSLELDAPSWATHAVVHFNDAGSGSGSIWTATSNGVTVLTHLMDNTSVEQVITVPLQGSGNHFKLYNPGGQTPGNGNPCINGVTFQQRLNAPITPAFASSAFAAGGTASLDISTVPVGALMMMMIAWNTAGPPALPSGWVSQASQTVGTHGYLVCSRVKQTGDTAAASTAPTGGVDLALLALNGAAVGQVTAVSTGTAVATSITPAAMDIAATTSWSLIAAGAGTPYQSTFTYPTGWKSAAGSNSLTAAGFALNTNVGGPGARLTPGSIAIASSGGTGSSDRIAWQIELTQAVTPVTENFVQVINNGHGGYQAHDYGFPVPGPVIGRGEDVNFYWASALALIKPDVVVFLDLGFNDLGGGVTVAAFQASMNSMITQIDLACGYQPDYMMGMYTYLAENAAGFSAGTWATWVAAMQTVSNSYGIRSQFFNLGDYIPAQPGPTAFTSLEPGTTNIAVHPTAFGNRMIGSLIAGALSNSIVELVPDPQSQSAATMSVNITSYSFPTATLNFSGAERRAIARPAPASLPLSGARSSSTTKALNASQGLLGSFVRPFSRALAAALSFSAQSAHAVQDQLTATLTPTGSTNRALARLLSGATALSGATSRQTQIPLSATFTSSAIKISATAKQLSARANSSGAIARSTLHQLGAIFSSSGRLSLLKGGTLFLNATLNFAGAASRASVHGMSAVFTPIGQFLRGPPLTAALSFIASLPRQSARALTGVLGSLGRTSRQSNRSLTGTAGLSTTSSKQTSRGLGANLTPSGALGRVGARLLNARLDLGGAIAKLTGHRLHATNTLTGAIVRAVTKGFVANLGLSSIFTKVKATTHHIRISLAARLGLRGDRKVIHQTADMQVYRQSSSRTVMSPSPTQATPTNTVVIQDVSYQAVPNPAANQSSP